MFVSMVTGAIASVGALIGLDKLLKSETQEAHSDNTGGSPVQINIPTVAVTQPRVEGRARYVQYDVYGHPHDKQIDGYPAGHDITINSTGMGRTQAHQYPSPQRFQNANTFNRSSRAHPTDMERAARLDESRAVMVNPQPLDGAFTGALHISAYHETDTAVLGNAPSSRDRPASVADNLFQDRAYGSGGRGGRMPAAPLTYTDQVPVGIDSGFTGARNLVDATEPQWDIVDASQQAGFRQDIFHNPVAPTRAWDKGCCPHGPRADLPFQEPAPPIHLSIGQDRPLLAHPHTPTTGGTPEQNVTYTDGTTTAPAQEWLQRGDLQLVSDQYAIARSHAGGLEQMLRRA